MLTMTKVLDQTFRFVTFFGLLAPPELSNPAAGHAVPWGISETTDCEVRLLAAREENGNLGLGVQERIIGR